MQSYLGFGPDVIGTPLEDIRRRSTAPEPRLSTLLMAGLRGIEYSDCEVALWRCHTDTLGRTMFNTSVLRAPDGSIDGVIGIGNDVERMRSLERQVIQAEKLATLGQLAAGVVHELNNPLTSISVYGDYLVRLFERGSEKGDLDKASKIVEGAARIQKLTRDLMSYARPSGEYERVALNEVVKQALVFCEHIVRRGEAEVTLSLGDELPRVHAIRAQLHQVLINLITNAIHALPPTGGHVTIGTELVDGGHAVQVRVADSGAGIGTLDRAHVFEPFFTTKGPTKGTGLGLSVVHGIVEQAGGRIEVRSEVGVGTTFEITLPAARAVLAAYEVAAVEPKRGAETIMFVDDDIYVRTTAARVLRAKGYTVLEADDGDSALAIMRACGDKVALLVTDIVMPGMDGPQLVEHARRAYPGLRILYSTGYTEDAVIKHGVCRDRVALIEKPFRHHALAGKVREILDAA
jgi:signal transduction histidine kinase